MIKLKNVLTSYPQKGVKLDHEVLVPGDKSISHRSMIMGALADGVCHVSGFLESEDCLATMRAMQDMGVNIEKVGQDYVVHGVGMRGLKQPTSGDLDCGNSGTGMRLLSGVLAAQSFSSTIYGDESLNSRPMKRISYPLSLMGAQVATTKAGTAPITFRPVERLESITYDSPVASAQVKSCVLLAGLYGSGQTVFSESRVSRDHTENMLQGFGVELVREGRTVKMSGDQALRSTDVVVPADISSAAFFMVLAVLLPKSVVTFKNICVNPTRTGVISILQLMGADISTVNEKMVAGECIADVVVKSSRLKGITIPQKYIASAIDEFPVLFIAAALAQGQTIVTGAEELRTKESDRIAVMAKGLIQLGVTCEESPDGILINGGEIASGKVDAHDDHRCAMSFLIAGQLSQGKITVENCENIVTSFPDFLSIVGELGLNIS